MDSTIEEARQRESGAAGPGVTPVSRRRFLRLGAAWTVGLVAFAAVGCGGEDDDDEGEDEED